MRYIFVFSENEDPQCFLWNYEIQKSTHFKMYAQFMKFRQVGITIQCLPYYEKGLGATRNV